MAATFAAGFGVAGLVDVGLATALAVVDLGVGFTAGFAAGFAAGLAAGLAAALAVVDLGAGFTAGFADDFAAALAVGFGVAAFEAGLLPLSFASGKTHPARCLQNYLPLMLFSKSSTEWFI